MRVFGATLAMFTLFPASIAYQDIASLLVRQPGVTERWQKQRMASAGAAARAGDDRRLIVETDFAYCRLFTIKAAPLMAAGSILPHRFGSVLVCGIEGATLFIPLVDVDGGDGGQMQAAIRENGHAGDVTALV